MQHSVDGVALTLLNETHLMKNFQMKLGETFGIVQQSAKFQWCDTSKVEIMVKCTVVFIEITWFSTLNDSYWLFSEQFCLCDVGPAIKLRCAIWEILGLCQTAQMPMPLGPMPQFLSQKQHPMAFPMPQHHTSLGKP